MGGASSRIPSVSTRDNDQGILKIDPPIAHMPPGDAAGQPDKRKGLPPVCREEKRFKYLDNGGGKQSNVEAQSRLFSCHPTEAARDDVLDPSGSGENMQGKRSFKLDGAKHKIFLSHSGTQKGFVEQLCVDLEARGYLFPFFDQRHHSLPKGKDFVPLIKEAARVCQVAVIVLSEEFLRSKWPMIELAEFHGAQQAGNRQLRMLPLFYKLSVGDLDDESIEKCWMPSWIEHANKDKRIDVRKWSAAVRAVRGANGLIFEKNAMSKVGYRKGVVQCISRLLPPELLYNSSRDMVGYDRMCETISKQFVNDSKVGALVLGLYGTSGVGKSTLSKALCDHFCGDYLGRVCCVELGGISRMERVKLILEKFCGFDMDTLHRITDVGQGLRQMQEHMKREPVFLAIDNVTNVESSWKEAFEYLMVGFHSQSRIMITSRSKCNVEELLPDVKFCMPMPKLSVREAGEIFLRSAAPMKTIFGLTDEERRILGLCIKQCWFESEDDDLGSELDEEKYVSYFGRRSYHPLALLALGDFFRRYFSNGHMLHWRDYLEKKDPLKDVWKSPNCVMSIIGLQFNTLHPSDQLLFLDIALYVWNSIWINWSSQLTVFCDVHDETPPVMKRKLQDLVKSGMIRIQEYGDYSVHALYREFAEWYVTEHGVPGLKNVWGVFQSSGRSLRCDPLASKCWSDLVRLRMLDLTRANARVLGSKRMQELHNLVVLQLFGCTYLTVLNLEGLESLRHLELVRLRKLEKVTLSGSSSADEMVGIYESLRYVVLEDLESLTHVPDLRSCTSLRYLMIWRCLIVTNFEGVECPHLKELSILGLLRQQIESLPNVKSLRSLEHVSLGFALNDELPRAKGDFLKEFPKMSCFRHFREYFLYLREWVLDVQYGPPWVHLIWDIRFSKQGPHLFDIARFGRDFSSLTHAAIEQMALLLHPDATAVSLLDEALA